MSVVQILLGLLVGPSILGFITHPDLVQNIAHIAAIVLLFVVGLEFKIKDVFTVRYGLIALGGVIVPWLGGFLTAKAFGYNFPSAVFTGTALTATSIAITVQVLKEMGKLQSEVAKAIIGAAVIDDVLGLLALSFSNQVVNGTFSLPAMAIPLMNSVLFFVIGIYLGTKFLSLILKRLNGVSALIFALVMAFAYALAAERIHLSGIVGAFLAGVSLEGAVVRHAKDFKKGAEYLYVIFGSVFFVSLGMLVDIHLVGPNTLGFLAALTVVAIVSKAAGCFFPAKWQGFSLKDSMIIGCGMAPRGEVAMIIGLIGLNQDLITQDIYAAIIVMSLATTVFTPFVLHKIFNK